MQDDVLVNVIAQHLGEFLEFTQVVLKRAEATK